MNKTTEVCGSELYYTNIKETELVLLVSERLHKSARLNMNQREPWGLYIQNFYHSYTTNEYLFFYHVTTL